MDTLDFTRSRALNNVPKRKLQETISTIENSTDDLQTKHIKLTAINRYAESNIPYEYWNLKMEKDYQGDKRLLNKYNEYISDLKASYIAGSSICLAGSHGVGKMISLETELPTPNGFVKLIDLKEGDQLFDEQGIICNVIKLHPIDLQPESYEVIFDDGSRVEACADHLWLTYTRNNRVLNTAPEVKSTKEILQSLRFKNGIRDAANHSIPCTKPLNYEEKELPIDPYVLGCWLGDGTSNEGSIECADLEILENIKNVGYSINLRKGSINKSKSCNYRIGDKLKNGTGNLIGDLTFKLRQSNLIKNKHIPEIYLHSSYEQRLSIIQGLLDTDGTCGKNGRIEYCTVLPSLANSFNILISSLGIKTKIKLNKSFLNGKRCKDRYRVTFTTKLPVFKLSRKLSRIKQNKNQLSRSEHRFIVEVNRIESKAMRCITVDSPSHLFLITRNFIPTHNTMATTSILKKACQKGYVSLYTTLSDIVNVLTQANGEEKFLARRELIMVDFLAIDEFDSRFMQSENAADLYARTLEGVFRTRSQNKLPTLMCTNSPNIVDAFNGPLKASIDSLMKGYMKEFVVLGEDFRKKK